MRGEGLIARILPVHAAIFKKGNYMNNIQHSRIRKNIVYGGAGILLCITLLSCVSSFIIYRSGFVDIPHPFDKLLALFAVIVVEGAFVWLVFGFTRAFSSAMERVIALGGMLFLCAVMLINLVTHFMIVKGVALNGFQEEWIQWGAVTVFIAVLLIVLCITLADPVVRLTRLELRYLGKEQETVISAKTASLDSSKLQDAITRRADWETDQLATRILPPNVAKPAIGYGRQPREDADPKDQSNEGRW